MPVAMSTCVPLLNISKLSRSVQLTILEFDLKAALKRALGGGLSGAAAMVLQVLLLMVRVVISLHVVIWAGTEPSPAPSNDHELPIPVRDFVHCCHADTVSRWRIEAVLSRHWGCSYPRFVLF